MCVHFFFFRFFVLPPLRRQKSHFSRCGPSTTEKVQPSTVLDELALADNQHSKVLAHHQKGNMARSLWEESQLMYDEMWSVMYARGWRIYNNTKKTFSSFPTRKTKYK